MSSGLSSTPSTPTSSELGYMTKLGNWVLESTKTEANIVIGWLFVVLVVIIVSLIIVYSSGWATWNGIKMPSWMSSSESKSESK